MRKHRYIYQTLTYLLDNINHTNLLKHASEGVQVKKLKKSFINRKTRFVEFTHIRKVISYITNVPCNQKRPLYIAINDNINKRTSLV